MIITIDGPVASGKSTIAKKLAASIGYIYFDTGAMYRILTYALIKEGISVDDAEKLKNFLRTFDFDIKIIKGDRRYFMGEEDVTAIIRYENVTSKVSKVSANPQVREKLVGIQRELAKGVDAVVEGRDMGTVVFPEAQIKIFLVGNAEVRAKRRYDELMTKYPEDSKGLTLERVLKEITERDTYDSSREISPLIKAADAFEVDTSDLSIDEIVFKILEYKDTLKTKHSKGSTNII